MHVTENLWPVSKFFETYPLVGRRKFYDMIANGEIPSFRMGKRILIDPAEVLNAMRSKSSQTGNR